MQKVVTEGLKITAKTPYDVECLKKGGHKKL